MTGIAAKLALSRDFYRLREIPETGSTNSDMKARALAGGLEGETLIAGRQRAGRGRLGRSFYSPPDTGLYISVLLRPGLRPEESPLITLAAAVAACRAIRAESGASPEIKWVNDLLLGGRKVCGILTEGQPGAYAVMGAGFNLCPPADGFPEEIQDIAGTIFPEGCAAERRSGLAARFLEEFYLLYRSLPDRRFMEEYRARSVIVPGRRVKVLSEPPYEAEAERIDDDGALLLRLRDGTGRRLLAGELSLRISSD
ncbi:MAG: biotin--[acetyl-CoA-carboxylase] ligase [Clostridia bacterium]|nr:biotin--[acetyl-CoA-carboxylase] ligase [Clostridia bacterium]